MFTARRVAFFSDSFHEVNGVALTSRQFEAFARRRDLPFFSVHAGDTYNMTRYGSVTQCELQRSVAALPLEAESGLSFDFLLWRYRTELLGALRAFGPDVLHVTGPGDLGLLGASLAYELGIPLAASWHTNVHEYAGKRLESLLSFLPEAAIQTMSSAAERGALAGAMRFYSIARVLYAPNQELADLLMALTGKPCYLMQRGVDATLYSPEKRDRGEGPFTVGYVGRLSVEKNVRFLATIEKALIAAGETDYRFLIVGPGSEETWLRENMSRADLPGVLTGEALARAYASMDVFAFPSETDTFGNVILEALASGVPAVVTTGGGPKFLVHSGVTGFIAENGGEFTDAVMHLMKDRGLLRCMKIAARQRACSISWDRVFEKVYEGYESILLPQRPLSPGFDSGFRAVQ